jgi:hypothetical protein
MLCYSIFLAASLFGLLVVPNSLAGAALQKQPPEPRTVSSQVRAACDAAYTIAAKIPGVSIQRRTGTFSDEMLREPVFGCGLAISGSFARAQTTGDAASRLHEDLPARAWQEMPAYSADGTDGTSFAFRKAGGMPGSRHMGRRGRRRPRDPRRGLVQGYGVLYEPRIPREQVAVSAPHQLPNQQMEPTRSGS